MLWTIIDMLGNSENIMAGRLKEYTGKLSYSLTNNPKHYALKNTKSSSRWVGVRRPSERGDMKTQFANSSFGNWEKK
jgi:hypothetical protein